MSVQIYDASKRDHITLDSLEAAQEWAREHRQHVDVREVTLNHAPAERWGLTDTGEIHYHTIPVKAPGMRRHEDADITSQPFVLPPKAGGEIAVIGWDIPSLWAIDAMGTVWGNLGGHGGGIEPILAESVIAEFENNGDVPGANEFRRLLGLPIPRPAWMTLALSAGWTPPEGWKDPEKA